VASLVATGLSTTALAERLFLSPWTVQDHLKSIFDKTGTRSRGELRARNFFDEFLPGSRRARRSTPTVGSCGAPEAERSRCPVSHAAG
jgi:hypothetical protein